MAANYKLYGLLLVFMNSNILAIGSGITFMEEPKTDKSCYTPNDSGILTTKVYIPDLYVHVPLDWYTIAWNPNPDGTGTWLINGSECLIYQYSSDRWKATFVYEHHSISYKMEVKNMVFLDETPGLYAFVIDRMKDLIVARSARRASFKVELESDCPVPKPTNNIPPNTKEIISASPTQTPSRTTSPSEEGYLSQDWNNLTSHMEEIKYIIRLIPTSTFHAGDILNYICSTFLAITVGIQLFFPDLYDVTRERFRALHVWRWIRQRFHKDRQQFPERGAPEENNALNTSNDPLDAK